MNTNATAAQVVSVRTKLKHMPEVASCSYLDHQASYRKLRAMVAKHEVPSAVASVLTPATTPAIFACKVWAKSDMRLVQKRFGILTGMMAVL